MSATRCAPFWAESPRVLFETPTDFFPFTAESKKCTATALNSLTRFGIYLGILLSLLKWNGMYLGITLGICILAVAAFYGMKQRGVVREGFADAASAATKNTIVSSTLFTMPGTPVPALIGGEDVANLPIADVIGQGPRTQPNEPNPFMNILVNEIKDNPLKQPAAMIDTPAMGRKLSDEFQTRVYGDPSDVFQHTQNQRTWVTMPSTSVPNDRDSFQNWLYRTPGRSCKEGNNAVCRSGTEGGVVSWLGAP
jgi:hypothetical protein